MPTANDNLGLTGAKRFELFRDRWSSFDDNAGVMELSEKLSVAQLKALEPFKEFDERLLELMSPDISVARWKVGSVLFEEGTYIDLAFCIARGRVDLFIARQMGAGGSNLPIFDETRTVIATDPVLPAAPEKPAPPGKPRDRITFLSTMDFDLPMGEPMSLGEGEIFGEIGALSGWPQSVTARTATDCILVQIRLPAIRLMRQRSRAFKERLDRIYRERSLLTHLKQSPLLSRCPDDAIRRLADRVELVSVTPGQVVASEGGPVNGLYIVRSGFLKLSQKVGAGNLTVSYLSKGASLGEAEILMPDVPGWLYTATSQQYAELVLIKREDLQPILERDYGVEERLWGVVNARTKEIGLARKDVRRSESVDVALARGLVEGTSILAIDLTVCTRCDDCVRGCADTHGGIARFVREGNRLQNLLITRACYHCQDPVCLVGCPTGAIRRAAVGAVVEIDDKLCIGCQSCANNCPYGAITMHETGSAWPADAIPAALRGQPRLLATKCDLCYQDSRGPACVRSCPHGCAVRVGSVAEFQVLLEKDA